MAMAQTARIVAVANVWDLQASPPLSRSISYTWSSHAEVLTVVAEQVNGLAEEVIGCSWQGIGAEAYRTRRAAISDDVGEAAALARNVEGCIGELSDVLQSAQEQLDQAWFRLRRRVRADKAGSDVVHCTIRTAEDSAVVERAVQAAYAIRRDADRRVRQIVAVLEDDVLPKMYRLLDALAQTNAAPAEGPDATYGTTIVRVGDKVYVTRGLSSGDDPYNVHPDTVTVTTDPTTREKVVTVNGVEHRFGSEVAVAVRDGLGIADPLPVAGYSPSPGVQVDRNGDQVHVTARLELSGVGASAEKAREIEERIEREWNTRFPDGSSVVTDVRVTYRPPGQAEAPDATQIEMAHLGGRATHVVRATGTMVLNVDDPNVMQAVHHEFGHQIGLGDRYTEPYLSNVSNHMFGTERWGFGVQPGYEHNVMDDNGAVSSQNLRDIPAENAPSVSTDDDQVRDWLSRRGAAELPGLATSAKIRMVGTLMDGWMSDADVAALEQICRTARPGEQADALRAAIGSRIGEMWGGEQQARLRTALEAMP